jgi:Gas vesicle protein
MGAVARNDPNAIETRGSRTDNLADVLERILDKGIVIAGDIRVDLLDIELLTIKLRLIVSSVEKAEQIGLDWWKTDPYLSGHAKRLQSENRDLKEQLEAAQHELRGGSAHSRDEAPAEQQSR